MKIVSTEIDESSVELTFSDNALLDAAEQLVIVRLPFEETMKRSLLWHQMNVLDRASELLSTEARRIRNELETM